MDLFVQYLILNLILQVILICLTVVFAILFLMMVVKYQRLRTHFGDYQVKQGI